MSHEVNTQNPILEPPATAVVDPLQAPFLEAIPEADTVMDESADAVMDDVFEDVERILREGSLPHDVVPPTPKPSNPLSSLAGNFLPSLLATKPAPPEETAIQAIDDLDVDDLAAIATEGGDLATLDPATTEPKVTQKSFDQLLLTLASISVLLTGGLWLMAQIFWKESPRVVATTPTEVTAAAPVSAGDREFLTYMARSLDVINRKVDLAQENATVASTSNSPNSTSPLPNVAVAGNTTLTPPTVLERVYVPVYQTPQGNAPAAVPPAPAAPQTVTVAPVPPAAPATSAAPATPAAPAASAAPSPNTPVPNIAAASNHALVGVLNLGDRSAALFTINGTTQRIGLGEMIGTSGWTLVSVNGQEAIIRRNGEVRSVYAGQQF